MPLLYADTSAVVGAYFDDETDHRTLQRLLLAGDEPILISELTTVEFASAVAAAGRGRRFDSPEALLSRFELDCTDQGGVFNIIDLDSRTVFPLARQLVTEHALRSMDAIHLATALTDGVRLARNDDLAMVTRDERQAAAAKACGIRVI